MTTTLPTRPHAEAGAATGFPAALRAELRKLATTRSFPALLAGTVVLTLFVAVGSGAGGSADADLPLAEQQAWLFTVLLTRLVFVVLGIRVVTDEFRHGTITPSLLATPSRPRLLLAQATAAAGSAVVLAVVAQGTLLAALAATSGLPPVRGEDGTAMAGMAVGAALWAVLGVGLGAAARHQLAVTVGAVLWLMLGEEVLRLRLGEAASYLPGHAGVGLAVIPGGDAPTQLLAGAVLLGWAAAAVAAGAVLLQRRDVA